jgi:hypothetical protein
MNFDPNEIAIQYYFGKLDPWKLPGIAADALEFGYDGSTLRKLAGMTSPTEIDIRRHEIDSAFMEMGSLPQSQRTAQD